MINPYLQTNVFPQINASTTVLTPNRRLAATLQKLYQTYQLEQQQRVWKTPDILPIFNWLERLWGHYTQKTFDSHPHLLTSIQEQFLWEKVIAHAKESEQLLQIAETATLAKSGRELLRQWQIDTQHTAFHGSAEYSALQAWIHDYENRCLKKNSIDHAKLPDLLLDHIKKNKIELPKHLLLIGFTELSPQLQQLLVHCREQGCEATHITLSAEEALCQHICLADQTAELLTMARWTNAILLKNPQARIGCVIPTLETVRDSAMQIFSSVFAEEGGYDVNSEKCPFNISAGKSLGQYPLIKTALELLSLYKITIPIETFSLLLGSPFLGNGESERIKRYQFDSHLRKSNRITINLQTLVQDNQSRYSLTERCPQLAKRLQDYLAILTTNPGKKTYSQWGNVFYQLLTALGWPGERSLTSEEYQVVDSWLELINQHASLDHISQEVSFASALQTLYKMATKTIFQPKSPDAPIQLLGVLEAAALPFDYLWVSGMDDLAWPPQPKPHPFIPKQLQRELQMPHATAARELAFCNTLLKQFKQSAQSLIFSHAEKNEEVALAISPLIRDIPTIQLEQLQLSAYTAPTEKIFLSKQIESFIDEIAPAVQPNEIVRGGINVLKQQALCPFKAFAECRLSAQEIETPLPGLRAKDRGNMLHKTLEILWRHLQDQATLNQMQDSLLTDLINQCIDQAFEAYAHYRQEYTQYITLEKKRLYKLIKDWLYIEKSRAPFKVIANEKTAAITLNQLNLAVRVDRIDELADGTKLIIDYKTGKHNDINAWFHERLDEPQLPLYTLIDKDKTVGITFAQLVPGDHGFKGVSHATLEIKGIKPLTDVKKATAATWAEQLTQWDAALTKLSDDFCNGIANVDPKDATQTCLYCTLKSLCRINDDKEIDHAN